MGKDGRTKTQIEDLDKTYDGDVVRDKRDGQGIEINRKIKNKIFFLLNFFFNKKLKRQHSL